MTEKLCIYQNNEQTSLEKKEVEPVEKVLKNIYQSYTYRKDLSWPHLDDQPKSSRETASEERAVPHILFFFFICNFFLSFFKVYTLNATKL